MNRGLFFISILPLFGMAQVLFAAETTSYEYDAQGRLIKSSKSDGPASGTEKCTSFDEAGNRTNQTVNSSGCVAGGGGGTNSPPNAVADTGSMQACTQKDFNLTANDTDPEGNYPLTIQSISGPLLASVISASSVRISSSASTGVKNFSYVVSDSLGATSTGYLNVTVSGICF